MTVREPTDCELSSVSEAERALAMQRFRLLQPHLEEGVALTTVTAQAGLCYRTAVRWVSLYRRFGLVALARKGRTDRGQRRAISGDLQAVVEALALQKPPLPIAGLYRRVCRIAEQRQERMPSYAVVYDIVRRLPADLVMLAHDGPKAYADTFEMVHRREAECSNAIWQADHTLLDIVVRREEGAPLKPWLTIIIDDYSRAIAGYFLSFEAPSSIQTALALRQAIWRKEDARWPVCGIPQVLYSDNGSDFTSQHMEQVAADLQMPMIFSTPGQPRGRGRIERFFSTLNAMFLSELPGHLPVSGGMSGQPTLTLADLDSLLCDFILDGYHQRCHSETKMAPKERWERGRHEGGGFLPRMPDSLEQLDLLLLTVAKTRKVHTDGVRFQGLRYVDLTLAAYIGESVLVRYDPRDVAEIRLFHQGQFLCRAICPELAGETIPLREVIGARKGRRRELRAVLRDRKQTVNTLLELKRGRDAPLVELRDSSSSTIHHSHKSAPLEGASPESKPIKRYRNE